MSPGQKQTVHKVLPLKPADFHILMVLLKDDLHGYGIMKAVEIDSGGRVQLEVGTMYRLIARLSDEGLIDEAPQANSDRRRYYRITEFGKKIARLEANRLADVVQVARSYDLLGDSEGM